MTLTVLEDFSCPMCTKWQKETLPSLQPLIDNGTLKLQWYNMVILSMNTALTWPLTVRSRR